VITFAMTGEGVLKKDFKIGIASENEFYQEVEGIIEKADQGVFPEKTVERVYFGDMKTLFKYIQLPKILR